MRGSFRRRPPSARRPAGACFSSPAPAVSAATAGVMSDGAWGLKGVTLTVSSGEIVGLLGPYDAGKTTSFYSLRYYGINPMNWGRKFTALALIRKRG